MDSNAQRISVKAGSIFRVRLSREDGVTPKNPGDSDRTKYIVVLGVDKDVVLVGYLLINSTINPRLLMEIGPYQHCIYSKDYSFMTKDISYIDCFQVKEVRLSKLISGARMVGTILPEDLSEAIQLTSISPGNRKAILKKYGISV